MTYTVVETSTFVEAFDEVMLEFEEKAKTESRYHYALDNLLDARDEALAGLASPALPYEAYPSVFEELTTYGMRWVLFKPYWYAFVVDDDQVAIMGAYHETSRIPDLVARNARRG